MNLLNLNDYVRGEYDCVQGYQAAANQTDAYYNGYADRYAQEQIASAEIRS